MPITDLVDAAKEALGSLKSERKAAYTARLEKLGQDATPLGFEAIDDVLADMATEGKFKEIPIRGSKPAETLKEIEEIIEDFRGRNPSEYHTAIAFDSMKQAIGEVRDAINIADNPAAWNLANKVYGAVRRTIVKQDADYAKAMREYEQATDLIIDIEKTFSLKGKRSAVDTQVQGRRWASGDGRWRSVGSLEGQGTVEHHFGRDIGGVSRYGKPLAVGSISSHGPEGSRRGCICCGEGIPFPRRCCERGSSGSPHILPGRSHQ
jgi:hypothetical protein